MSPFYPIKAKEKDISSSYVGMVMGTFPIAQLVSAFLVGKCLQRLGGRATVIVIGQMMIVVQTVLLGYLQYEDDRQAFLILSFLAQTLGGAGGGSNQVATLALVSSWEKEEREQNIGIMEASYGVGMLIGPMIGAFLYSIGGYQAPFFFFAMVYFFTLPCIARVIWENKPTKSDGSSE